MVRYYCDVCDKELHESDHGRLALKLGDVSIAVMHSMNGVWNKGLVCHNCIREVIAHGRPPLSTVPP
jgi:hypothetical protein